MYKRGFSSSNHNTNTIIDVMASQTKHIMEEIVRKTDVLTSKLIEGSGTNGSNLMDILIEEEEEEEGNEYFDECFDDKVLDLRRKSKWDISLGKRRRKIYGGISS